MTDRKLAAVALSVFGWTVSAAFGQSEAAPHAGAKLEFEVASIKAAAPMQNGMMRVGMNVDAGRMTYENVSLRDCIRAAYRIKDYQISGPDWLASVRFDINAKLPEGATREQVPEMLQALLADRFKMTLHHETKDHSVYALVVGKGGPKLKEADPEAKVEFSMPAGGPTASGGAGGGEQRMVMASRGGDGGRGPGAPGGGGMMMRMGPQGAQIEAKKVTLPVFADMLSRFVDRPVINQTEIQGSYDFNLDVASDEMMRNSRVMIGGMAVGAHGPGEGVRGEGDVLPPDGGAGGTIFQSVQKYGLKLDPRKAPMDTLVIDRIEKAPTEN